MWHAGPVLDANVDVEQPDADTKILCSGPRLDRRDLFTSGLIGCSGVRANGHPTLAAGDRIRCVHGANEQNLPIQGRTVAWARENLASALNISPVAISLVNGVHVGEDHALAAGTVLEFLDSRGQKGLGEVFSPESLIERMKITKDDFEDMVASGLPVHRMRDGSLRISETQLDRFLDHRVGQGRVSDDAGSAQPVRSPEEPLLKAMVDDLDARLSAIQASLSTLVQQRVIKDYYTTEEVARIVERDAYTVREWCRYGRLRAMKRPCGRGTSPEWSISHEELLRYQNEGLLPLRK